MPFEKGQSGNPGGRPKENAEVKRLAKEHGVAAITKLAALMESEDERIVLGACQALLDRGYGKPAQTIAGDPDAPLEIIQKVERVLVRPNAADRDS